MTSTYSPIALKPAKPFHCRPLLPIYPPNGPLNYPSLPSKPRQARFSASFTLSTHIFPAAHLRRGPQLPVPYTAPDAPKHERERVLDAVNESLHQNWKNSSIKNGKHEKLLWNVVNRYVRNDLNRHTSTGVTLFFAHANGYTKEIWEPILARVLTSSVAPVIDEVWTWECVQHGDAALINADHLSGGIFDWSDNARDINNFLLHFLPSNTLDKSLPVHLPRIPIQETEKRLVSGLQRRTLIATGHSFGGTSLVLGACSHHKLFSALILLDPVIMHPEVPRNFKWGWKAIKNALGRKDTWESKEQVYIEFSSSPHYKNWDLDMLETHVDTAFYETTVVTLTGMSKPAVKSKITGYHEALVFTGGEVPMEAFISIQNLDESVRLHFIVSGAEGAPQFGPPGSQQERVWLRPKNSSNAIIKKAGHLIPQEAPEEVAREIIQFLETYYHKALYQPLRSNL